MSAVSEIKLDMPIYISLCIGLLAGTLRALQGSYKDVPWEDFNWMKFGRSMLLGSFGGLVWWIVLDLLGVTVRPALFFGMAVFFDSIATEIYKRGFRIEDLRKYKMPTIFHIQGKVIHNRFIRGILGIMIVSLLAGLFWLLFKLNWVGGWPFLAQGLVWGSFAGLMVAVGGALLDSAWEGFEPFKFPRSIFHGAYWGVMFSTLETNPALLVFSILGMDRMGLEFYKSFLRKMKSGKFLSEKPVNVQWYSIREKLLFPYMMVWMVFGYLLVVVR